MQIKKIEWAENSSKV